MFLRILWCVQIGTEADRVVRKRVVDLDIQVDEVLGVGPCLKAILDDKFQACTASPLLQSLFDKLHRVFMELKVFLRLDEIYVEGLLLWPLDSLLQVRRHHLNLI